MRFSLLARQAVMLLATLAPAFASNLKPIRSADLHGELCAAQAQQYNSPLSGVDFVSEDEVLVFTVCRVNVALSVRDRFQSTDPNHLRAVILNVATGVVKQRFDWPTHGHGSQVHATHGGQLLVRQDNLLQILTPEGKTIASLQVNKAGLNDSIHLGLSPAVDTIALGESSSAPNGNSFSNVAVLDARNLHLLARWPESGDIWSIAASPEAAARTSDVGSGLDVRGLKAGEWKTVFKGTERSILHPVFVSDSELAVPAENDVQLFSASGEKMGKIACPKALKVAVSRDGNVVAMMCLRSMLGPSFLPGSKTEYGSIGIDVYRLAPQRHLGSLEHQSWAAFSYDFALSPSGAKLAVIHDLQLEVFAGTD